MTSTSFWDGWWLPLAGGEGGSGSAVGFGRLMDGWTGDERGDGFCLGLLGEACFLLGWACFMLLRQLITSLLRTTQANVMLCLSCLPCNAGVEPNASWVLTA